MHSPTESQSANLVSEWGYCPGCDTISKHSEKCTSCRATDLAQRARLRPAAVFAVSEDDHDAVVGARALDKLDIALLVLPADCTPMERSVAHEMANRATARLVAGDSLDFALMNVAGGQDSIAAGLRAKGLAVTRDQVAYALHRLHDRGVVSRNGRCRAWVDHDEPGDWKKKPGAWKYTLHIAFRKLGNLALGALTRLSGTQSATVRGNRTERRLTGLLEWALRHAQVGERNSIGRWVADRLTDGWLPEDKVWEAMRSYCAEVNLRTGGPAYTWAEAQRTLLSQLRRKS